MAVEAKDFTSENAEVLAAVDLIRAQTQDRGIRAIDRGGDRRFRREALMSPANLPLAARDSQFVWWIAQTYLTRWKIEETFLLLGVDRAVHRY